jgi:hypothetical protein
MKYKILNISIWLSVILLTVPPVCKAQEFGDKGFGLQRATWTLWGPSWITDLNRHFGVETIIGIIPFPKTNSDVGFFERIIVRPLTYKTNSFYIAPIIGTERWEYALSDGTYFYKGKEWSFHYGIMAGIEVDLRMVFPKLFPLFINGEFGYEGW